MTRRQALAAAAILLVAAGLYAAWRVNTGGEGPFGAPGPNAIIISGNIEAHESALSFTSVQAPIVELPFDEGAEVKQGTTLARVDNRLYRQQVEIDRANVQVAHAQVAANQSSLAAAQHNVTSDEADLAEKQVDYMRAERLLGSRSISVQARDLAATAEKQSAATLAHDQSIVEQAQANLDAAKAKLRLDEITLGYATLTAPFSGVIAVREAELGELAGPGVAIFTLDDLDHIWLRAYVNEPDLGKIRLGEAVEVATDTYPGKIYHGRISFISPEAEFTPKTVQTFAERITLVYRVRIDIDNPTHELLPGMPADARIPLLPPGP